MTTEGCDVQVGITTSNPVSSAREAIAKDTLEGRVFGLEMSLNILNT